MLHDNPVSGGISGHQAMMPFLQMALAYQLHTREPLQACWGTRRPHPWVQPATSGV